jgi:hypothetical protein
MQPAASPACRHGTERCAIAWLSSEDNIWFVIACDAEILPSAAATGRPIERMSVFVSLRDADAKVLASGAVTLTSFQVGVTLPEAVT